MKIGMIVRAMACRWGLRCAMFSVASLIVWILVAAPLGFSEPAAAAAASRLEIDSDPPGAGVYLDGRLVGQTPIRISHLPAGDHRLRLVKDGYLENGRLVALTPQRLNVVRVALTPRSRPADGGGQLGGVQRGGGGGSKKWLWIGLAGAGAGAAAVIAVKNKNRAPTVGSIGLSPNEAGLAAATVFSFTAVDAGDPDGDSLAYSWDFGDGATGAGTTVPHTYTAAGTRTVTLTVSDGKASATATRSVTVRDLAGAWAGTVSVSQVTLTLSQSGTSISGSYSGTLQCLGQPFASAPITGNVSSPKSVQLTMMFNTVSTCGNVVLSGSADANINTLSGSIVSGLSTGTQTFSVTRR